MPTPQKAAAIGELTEKLKRAKLAVVTDYRGLKVKDLATLRRTLHGQSVDYTVAKNTLLVIAARANNIEGAEALFAGPSAVAFCYDDIVGPAKAISDFARVSRILTIRGGLLDGRPVDANQIGTLATLPPVEQLRAELVGAISGPMSNLVGVLNGVLQLLVATLEARVSQQEGDAGEAGEANEAAAA